MLTPEDEELEENVTEPAASTPYIPFINAAIFIDPFFGDDALPCEVGYVFKELVDHIGDDLQVGQGVDNWVRGW